VAPVGRQLFFPGSGSLPFSQANTGASAILVNKFDAGSFECAPNYVERCAARLGHPRFDLPNCDYANPGLIRKILLAPIKETACCPTLRRGNHLQNYEGSL
jgi:hypothetical protein